MVFRYSFVQTVNALVIVFLSVSVANGKDAAAQTLASTKLSLPTLQDKSVHVWVPVAPTEFFCFLIFTVVSPGSSSRPRMCSVFQSFFPSLIIFMDPLWAQTRAAAAGPRLLPGLMYGAAGETRRKKPEVMSPLPPALPLPCQTLSRK